MKKCQCGTSKVAGLLVTIGGINWGLVGIGMLMGSDWNVVHMILKSAPAWIEGVVYLVVGIATVMALFGCKCAKCKACMAGGMNNGGGMGGQNM